MKQTILGLGALWCGLSVILGAFGAHLLKKYLTVPQLESFETGTRYQMYAGLLLLIMGIVLPFQNPSSKWIAYMLLSGSILFSFSIYLLSLKEHLSFNMPFLGPITPLGGLLMIISLFCFAYILFTQNRTA